MKRGAKESFSSKKKKIKTEQIQDVPNEIWQVIFSHLPPSFLDVVRQVSTGWHALVHNLSEQSLHRYFSYLMNHPDYRTKPLSLFIKEYQRYHAYFSTMIPMDAILFALQENTESILSKSDPDSQKILYGLRFAKGYPLPEKGLSKENILEIKGWAILFAAWQNNTQLLDELLILQEIDKQYKNTTLLFAVQNKDVKVITQLIAHGADVNTTSHDGVTPIYIAAQSGQTEVVAKLVELGANVNTATNDGVTPIFIAVQERHLEMITKLVELGADVNTATNDGVTPIFIAVQERHVEMIMKLVELGADVNTATNDGATPIFIAVQERHVEMITKLVELGADVNTATNDGATPMFIAAHQGHVDVITKLVALGADVNKAINNGGTPIFIAVQERHAKVVQFLLEQNVHIQPYISSAESLSNFAQSRGGVVIDRMDQFIQEKIQEGNPIEKIPLLPSEIAYIMGHDEIVNMFKTFNNANHNEVVAIIGSHPCSQSSPITFVFDAKKDSSSSSEEENSMEIDENNQEQSFLSRYYYG